MIRLAIHGGHNASAALMIDGVVVGAVQEERLTKRKNQTGFPARAIEELVATHLEGDFGRIQRVVEATVQSDPYTMALDRYADFSVHDHVKENHEYWHPHFYGAGLDARSYWLGKIAAGERLNRDHNYDFAFLRDMSLQDATHHFNTVERFLPMRRLFGYRGDIQLLDHHSCHAHYAVYGDARFADSTGDRPLVMTADAFGDGLNWSVSRIGQGGRIERVSAGNQNTVARLYKFVTLILGMKPNEHEYKVMGLAPYCRPSRYSQAVLDILLEALDFEGGSFRSRRPLRDSYFDLKARLEGHRFDNVAHAVQAWCTLVTEKWMRHWLRELDGEAVYFSGGLSQNIKTNGDLLERLPIKWMSVPASGGDESLSMGALYMDALAHGEKVTPLRNAYLGAEASRDAERWQDGLARAGVKDSGFRMVEKIGTRELARLLAAGEVLARCDGRSEFGARALGNRSILANPSKAQTIKLINDAIKSRDFWMPFAPAIRAESAARYLISRHPLHSPSMMLGFETSPDKRHEIIAACHPADYTARPQIVTKADNPDFHALLSAFEEATGTGAVLNTSLNLHGDPTNYSAADAVRTLALSELDFLALPDRRLLVKERASERLHAIVRD